MMGIPGDVAIKTRASGSSWRSRAYPLWTKRLTIGLAIRFLFAEEPKRGFGEMPRHGADGLRVALAPGDALVEATDVAVRVAAAHQTDRVRGFDECPFEVAVDVGAESPVAHLVTARVDAAGAAGVAGELLGGGKAGDVADLERDH